MIYCKTLWKIVDYASTQKTQRCTIAVFSRTSLMRPPALWQKDGKKCIQSHRIQYPI